MPRLIQVFNLRTLFFLWAPPPLSPTPFLIASPFVVVVVVVVVVIFVIFNILLETNFTTCLIGFVIIMALVSSLYNMDTVNSEIYERFLFSQIAFKSIYMRCLKLATRALFAYIDKRQ